MKRREFLGYSALIGLTGSLSWAQGGAAPATKTLTEKDIAREGKVPNLPNYCEQPEKQPNKFCPSYSTAPNKGICDGCQFYNKETVSDYKGGKFAKCILLGDPSKAQYVGAKAWCASYVKRA